MRMELRVCKHCYEGDHGGEKAAMVQDMVACAEAIANYRDALQLTEVYVTPVEEGDVQPAQALPAFAATLREDDVHVRDTQLVMEDPDGNMLVYPDYADILEVLVGNVDIITDEVPQAGVELSEASRERLD